VTPDYGIDAPYRFTGGIERVRVDLKPAAQAAAGAARPVAHAD
jgi:hypothetical protein